MIEGDLTVNNVNATMFKNEMTAFKEKLEKIEAELQVKIQEIETKQQDWSQLDREAEELVKSENKVIRFNVGGKKFTSRVDTLLSQKDTFFYRLLLCKDFDLSKEIFIDRSSKYFSFIIDFIRYNSINFSRLDQAELGDLLVEADFYEVEKIIYSFRLRN